MLRLIVLLLFVSAVSLGLAWVADEPGRVAIDWADYHLETSLLVIISAMTLGSLICMVIYSVVYAVVRTPHSWLRSRLAKRQALGLAALTDAFAAIATQDIGLAKKQITRAQQFLPHQPLTLMLASQVARLEGNESQSRLYLEQMLKAEGTEFIAMRGLIETARRSHDDAAALKYAEKALAIKPQDSWLITTLVGLYTAQSRTQNALQLLDQSARKRYISRKELREMSAYVLYENARTLAEQKRWDFAIAVLEDILRKLPEFTPASAMLADAYLTQGEIKRALKVIGNAWKIAPHPALTQALMRSYDAGKEQRKVVFTVEKLAQTHPEERESRFLTVQLALRRADYETARRYLKYLLQEKETVRVCTLMAELETAKENNDQAASWLKRAGSALPEPAWTCDSCRHTFEQWQLTCAQCGSVATVSWK